MIGFSTQKGKLFCDEVSVESIGQESKTPFYLYSHGELKKRIKKFKKAFSDYPTMICYALKANSNGALLSTVEQEGLGADIVSGGELTRALEAGISPNKIVFAGLGKTKEEIKEGLKKDILAFNVESFAELKLISKTAEKEGREARISFRVNPGIDPNTHPYISTGMRENKFGIDLSQAEKGYRIAKNEGRLDPIGIQAHIGSQITEAEPFRDAISKLVDFTRDLACEGLELQFIDIGGGLGIPYKKNEVALGVGRYAEIIKAEMNKLAFRPQIIIEPGRTIAGPAGILVSEVTYVKEKNDKIFLVLDAGMNDFIRPSLYEAWHEILPLKPPEGPGRMTADVVGPVCESSDFFAKDRQMPRVEAGDRLAIMDAGAYGYSLASNYNSRVRPSEIMVKDKDFYPIRDREDIENVTRGERIPPFLE